MMKKGVAILFLLIICTGIGYAHYSDTKKGESNIINITEADFLTQVIDYKNDVNEWKYLGDKPAIIDFYADWCGPCRKLTPILEEVATEYKGDIIIYKVNVDDERNIANAFGIRSLPTLFFVPTEGRPSIVEGFLPKEELQKAISATILKK